MRVLIVEDEPQLSSQIQKVLEAEGHVVDTADNGTDGQFLGETEPYDSIVLDLGLPGRDGISVLKDWRRKDVATPVMILTARDDWSDRVDGLDAGADDYMSKPFNTPELCARVRAMIRRGTGNASAIFKKDGVEFDARSSRTMLDGIPVVLTTQETAVLSYLFHNSGRLVTRTELSEHIYDYDGDKDSNTIAVFVTRLRKKLGSDLIVTVRGGGYMIAA
ncbi:MAG: response regulator transcription factor [Boseongicola sp.]